MTHHKEITAVQIKEAIDKIGGAQMLIRETPELGMETMNGINNELEEAKERLDRQLRYVYQAEEIEAALKGIQSMRRALDHIDGFDYDAKKNVDTILKSEIARLEPLLRGAYKKAAGEL